jgi:hypothetical protein
MANAIRFKAAIVSGLGGGAGSCVLRNRMVFVLSEFVCAVVTAGKLEKTASRTKSRLLQDNNIFKHPIPCYIF